MEQSTVGAEIELCKIPTDYDIRFATTGGEDYELLLTVAHNKFDEVAAALLNATGTTLTKVGRTTADNTLTWLDDGKPSELELKGFTHF